MKAIKKKYLDDKEYFQEEYDKTQIVLHHTESSTWLSAWSWWNSQEGHIGTAYIIDKDGTIIECFNPKHWAYHTGTGKAYDRHSIGIELVNEGKLKCKDANLNEEKFTWGNNYIYKYDIGNRPLKLFSKWRGEKYFANYTNEQLKSLYELTLHLCNIYKIPKVTAASGIYNEKYSLLEGIVTHANIKESKTDLNPSFSMNDLEKYINRPQRGCCGPPPPPSPHAKRMTREDATWAKIMKFIKNTYWYNKRRRK